MYTKYRICEGVEEARGRKVMMVVTSQSMDSHTRQEPWATTELSGRTHVWMPGGTCTWQQTDFFFFIMHGVVQVILINEGICASRGRGVGNVL